MLLGEGMRLDRPYRVQNEGEHAAVNFGEAQKQADRSSNSRSSYVPSMTPIFNEYSEDERLCGPPDSRRQSPTPSSQ